MGQLLAAELAQQKREAGAHAAAEHRVTGPPVAPRCGSKFLPGLAREALERAKRRTKGPAAGKTRLFLMGGTEAPRGHCT